jgi:MFS family permease
VATLFVVAAINFADRSSITAVFPLLRVELGFTDVGLGAIGSVFLWSYALASPFSGYLSDRTSRSRMITWTLAGWSLATVLAGFSSAPWQLLAMRFVLGAVESMFVPAAMALVADYHDSRTRGTALGFISVGNYIGLLAGGTIGGYLGEHLGWRSPLWVLGAGGIAFAVVCEFILPRTPRAVSPSSPTKNNSVSFSQAARRLGRIPSYLVLAIAGVLTSIGAWIFINWLPLYFHEAFAMTLAHAGFYGSFLIPATSAVSQVIGGPISDLVSRKGLHHRMLLQAIFILCAAPSLLPFLLTHDRHAIMTSLVAYAVCRSCADLNILPLVCDLAGPDKTGTALGITNMLNTLAGGLGIFFAGVLKSRFGLAGIFGGVALILLLDAVLLFAGYALFLKKDIKTSSGIRD